MSLLGYLWYNKPNLDKWSTILNKTFRVKSENDFQMIFIRGKNVAN
ncbi:ribonuclease P protein component, partial [Streptococcus agalactiae]|nr:ribonuclease P protein component [Streptococcus agalactiae]MCK6291658.1 ribonuclease P protein component [Streptococcus agalactiae]